MPSEHLTQPVDVLEELPGQPALADAPLTDDRDQACRPVSCGCMELVLEQPELVVASDEGRLEDVPFADATALTNYRKRPPGGHRNGLALHVLLAHRLVANGVVRQLLGGVADKHGPRVGCRLEPRRGVDDVADDEALLVAAGADRGLTGKDTGPDRELWDADLFAERLDGVDQLEGSPDRPLRVVLFGLFGSPEGGNGIADEFVHLATETLDGLSSPVEVAGQHRPYLFGVPRFAKAGEADQVGEQHRHEAPLTGFRCWAGRRRSPPGSFSTHRGATVGAEVVSRRILCPAARARQCKPGPAVPTELRFVWVLGRAVWAGDHPAASAACSGRPSFHASR